MIALDGIEAIESAKFWNEAEENSNISRLKMILGRADIDRIVTAAAVAVSGVTPRPLSLESKGSKKILDALVACEDELLISWNIDPADTRAAVAPAEARTGMWLLDSDYPREAADQRHGGINTIVFRVGPDNQVHDCQLIEKPVGQNSMPYPARR